MAGLSVDLVDFRKSFKGKIGHLLVNSDPPNDNNDLIDFESASINSNEYMAEVIFFDDDEIEDYHKDITDRIIEEEIAASNVDCYYGILYSASEFPKESSGIENPDIVLVIGSNRLSIANTSIADIILEFNSYNTDEIIQYITDSIKAENQGYGVMIDAEDFAIFVGNIEHISCVTGGN